MRKTIVIIASVILAGVVLFTGQSCFAQDKLVEFTALGGTVINGYVNTTNTGFKISGIIPNLPDFSKAKLLVRGAEESFLTPGEYSFSQTGLSLTDLKEWFPEGINQIKIDIYNSLDQVIDSGNINIIADYSLNAVNLEVNYDRSKTTNDGYLKIGDSANFKVISDEKLNLDGITSQVNGRTLSWVEQISGTDFIYLSQYEVTEGEADLNLPYQIQVSYQDIAGNGGEIAADFENAIDSNAPDIRIKSIKEGQIFSEGKVKVRFISNEALSDYEIILNGKIVNIANGEVLNNLKDGKYILQVHALDLAGNITTVQINFIVDTKLPATDVTLPANDSYNQGDELIIEGKTDPNSRVVIEIQSESRRYETVSDNEGNWRILIDTSELSEGMHEIYLEITDPAGNKSRVLLGVFEIVVPKLSQQDEGEPILLAQAPMTEVVSDVRPTIIERKVEDGEKVAIEPKIISSSDERQLGINWSAWLILIGLIAVSFLVAGVSYYGYSQAVAIVNRKKIYPTPPVIPKQEKKPNKKPNKKEIASSKNKVPENSQSDGEEDIQARW